MTAILLAVLLLSGQSTNAAALSAEALKMAQQKRFDEAERLWKQSLEISPNFFDALFNLGLMHFGLAQYAKAEPFLARAAEARPKDFNAHYVLGAALTRMGRSEDGLRQWRKSLELQPDNAKLMTIMSVEYSKGRYFREAAEIAQRALALKSDDENIYFVAIKAYQDAADHPSALKVAELAVKRFPLLPRANFEHGFELHRAGRPEEGLPYIKKAMEGSPDYEEPFFFYGEILLNDGRYDDAIPPLRRAIQLRRDYMAAWVALGRALMGLGRYKEASEELRRSLEIDPDHPHPHLLLSQVYFRMGDEQMASKEKQLSLRLRRENPTAMEAPQGRPFPK